MTVSDWSTNADLNIVSGGVSGSGGSNIAEGCPPSGINNAIRSVMAQVADYTRRGSDLASASTLNLDSIDNLLVNVTGTTTVTAVTLTSTHFRLVRATGAFQITASSSLIVNGQTATNYTTAANDLLLFEGYGSSVVRVWLLSKGTIVPPPSDNLIVNPRMQISQLNLNTAGTTAAYYAADMWRAPFVTSAGALSFQRVQSVTPRKSKDRLRLSVTTADSSLATGEFLGIVQSIEGTRIAHLGFGASGATQLVLRFGVKAPAGTYAVAIRNSAANRSYVKEYTISAADTDTEVTLTFPGDTSGTWPTSSAEGMTVFFAFAAGATFQTTANAWQAGSYFGTSSTTNGLGANTNVFEIFDVGLYADPDSLNVAPPWRPKDEAADLIECMRYFEKSHSAIVVPTTVTDLGAERFRAIGASHNQGIRYSEKRVAPTVTLYNPSSGATGTWRDVSAGTDLTAAANDVGTKGCYVAITTSVAGNAMRGHWTADARM